jgi:hypothetical protein
MPKLITHDKVKIGDIVSFNGEKNTRWEVMFLDGAYNNRNLKHTEKSETGFVNFVNWHRGNNPSAKIYLHNRKDLEIEVYKPARRKIWLRDK